MKRKLLLGGMVTVLSVLFALPAHSALTFSVDITGQVDTSLGVFPGTGSGSGDITDEGLFTIASTLEAASFSSTVDVTATGDLDGVIFADVMNATATCFGIACPSIGGLLDDLEMQVNNKTFDFIAVGESDSLVAVDGNSSVTVTFTTTSITPIPVPAAAWLFASALGALGWVRRRYMTSSRA